MANIVHFSEAASIGFHAMVLLARFPEKEMHRHDIAVIIHVSEAHLSKVLQRLRRAGLINAVRGPNGGYKLAVDPATIFLRNIYVTIDGEPERPGCLLNSPRCVAKSCLLGNLISDLSGQVDDFLAKTTLQMVCCSGMAIVEK
ncbi:MAG: hypothetical protein A2W80_11485 [Candidatus Riflebacteria bacterium GWC2_50_8]|nr:MAG: hypothetical protein A2W80_11485 [Candidatus Riflebacteria bacterium GWC2_50_8]